MAINKSQIKILFTPFEYCTIIFGWKYSMDAINFTPQYFAISGCEIGVIIRQ
jgi:hypothetical protein